MNVINFLNMIKYYFIFLVLQTLALHTNSKNINLTDIRNITNKSLFDKLQSYDKNNTKNISEKNIKEIHDFTEIVETDKNLNCKDIKCPITSDPICVEMRKPGYPSYFVMMLNKCEMQYVKCNPGVLATEVPMKHCEISPKGTKRSSNSMSKQIKKRRRKNRSKKNKSSQSSTAKGLKSTGDRNNKPKARKRTKRTVSMTRKGNEHTSGNILRKGLFTFLSARDDDGQVQDVWISKKDYKNLRRLIRGRINEGDIFKKNFFDKRRPFYDEAPPLKLSAGQKLPGNLQDDEAVAIAVEKVADDQYKVALIGVEDVENFHKKPIKYLSDFGPRIRIAELNDLPVPGTGLLKKSKKKIARPTGMPAPGTGTKKVKHKEKKHNPPGKDDIPAPATSTKRKIKKDKKTFNFTEYPAPGTGTKGKKKKPKLAFKSNLDTDEPLENAPYFFIVGFPPQEVNISPGHITGSQDLVVENNEIVSGEDEDLDNTNYDSPSLEMKVEEPAKHMESREHFSPEIKGIGGKVRANEKDAIPDLNKQFMEENKALPEVNMEQYIAACPNTCPIQNQMVCARCRDRIYRTFPSICHLRIFNCKLPNEQVELVSREPCSLSSPFFRDLRVPQGRITEPGDDDIVLRYKKCERDRETYGIHYDPRCDFKGDYYKFKYPPTKNKYFETKIEEDTIEDYQINSDEPDMGTEPISDEPDMGTEPISNEPDMGTEPITDQETYPDIEIIDTQETDYEVSDVDHNSKEKLDLMIGEEEFYSKENKPSEDTKPGDTETKDIDSKSNQIEGQRGKHRNVSGVPLSSLSMDELNALNGPVASKQYSPSPLNNRYQNRGMDDVDFTKYHHDFNDLIPMNHFPTNLSQKQPEKGNDTEGYKKKRAEKQVSNEKASKSIKDIKNSINGAKVDNKNKLFYKDFNYKGNNIKISIDDMINDIIEKGNPMNMGDSSTSDSSESTPSNDSGWSDNQDTDANFDPPAYEYDSEGVVKKKLAVKLSAKANTGSHLKLHQKSDSKEPFVIF